MAASRIVGVVLLLALVACGSGTEVEFETRARLAPQQAASIAGGTASTSIVPAVVGGLLGGDSSPGGAGSATPGATTPTVPATGAPIKLGIVLPLQGGQRSFGEPILRTTQAFIEELNSLGGVNGSPIELISYNACLLCQDEAYEAVRRLVEQDGVFAIVNTYVMVVAFQPVIPYLVEHGVPLIQGGAENQTTDALSPINFATAPSGAFYANFLPAMATDYVHATKVAITYLDVPSEANGVPILKAQLEARGVQVVDTEPIGAAEDAVTNMDARVTKMRAAGAQAVLATNPVLVIYGRLAADRQGWDSQWFGPAAWSRLVEDSCGVTCDDLVLTDTAGLSWIDRDTPQMHQYLDTMARRYPGGEFTGHTLAVWVGMQLTVEALRRSGPDRAAFIRTIESFDNLDLGTTSALTFSPDRHLGGTRSTLLRLKDGHYIAVSEPVTFGEADLWIFFQYAVLGLAGGAVFALLAVGLVLVYRASGVLNFAHASMGMACAYVNFELLERAEWMPVGVALAISILVGSAIGVAVYELVFRPMASAPQVVRLLASFGLAGVLQGLVGLLWARLGTPNPFGHSLLPLNRGVHVAGVVVPWQRAGTIVAGITTSIGSAALVNRTSFGVQLRALAQNPLAARLAGVDERRVQRGVWALAGATAALAGVLVIPFGVLTPLALNGFLLKALAAAVVGGFASLAAAVIGGLGIGVVQELLVGAPAPFNGLRSALASALVLVLLLVGVERFFVSPQEARALEGDDRPASSAARAVVLGRPAAWLAGGLIVALAITTLSGFWAFVVARTLVYALLGLSLVVLTGWSGQVSLMPGTFAGVGACLSWLLSTRYGYPMPLVLPLAAAATVPVCALVGVVALRLRPLYVAVATIALAGLFEDTLFRQNWFANGGRAMTVVRPHVLRGDRAFACGVLALATAVFAFTAAVGRARSGRAIWMTRDNPRAAAAGGVNPVKYRLLAFSLSAAIAGLAGALFAYLLGTLNTETFGFLILSLAAFGLVTVGGIRSPLGAAVGAFLFVYVTELFRTSGSVSDWTSVLVGAGIIVVLARTPDGIVGAVQRVAARGSASRA